MKIIYLTTSTTSLLFDELISKGYKLNPAGQNFHSKLITYLSKYEEVKVYSLPSLYLTLQDEGNYSYITFKSKITKKLFGVSKTLKLIEESIKKDDVIIFDSTSAQLSKIASILSKKEYKTVAILTDNPFNITYQSNSLSKQIIENTSTSFASISLTKELTSLFKLESKPSLNILGIMENNAPIASNLGNYIYFSGALFAKYGVKELLDAYLKAKPNLDLIIAGHGDMEEEIKSYSKSNKRIKYLGQISKDENYKYESEAYLNINPRPYPSIYDLYSIPSKLIEYLSLSKHIASRYCSPLDKYFPISINLIEGSIYDFFILHMDKENNLINLKENDYLKTRKDFSGDKISKDIISFLKSLN